MTKVVRTDSGRVLRTRSNVRPTVELGFILDQHNRYKAVPIGTPGVTYVSVSEAQGRRLRARYDESLKDTTNQEGVESGRIQTQEPNTSATPNTDKGSQVEASRPLDAGIGYGGDAWTRSSW